MNARGKAILIEIRRGEKHKEIIRAAVKSCYKRYNVYKFNEKQQIVNENEDIYINGEIYREKNSNKRQKIKTIKR